jgi:hypothetical protein
MAPGIAEILGSFVVVVALFGIALVREANPVHFLLAR